MELTIDNPLIKWNGRNTINEDTRWLYHCASGFEVLFSGDYLTIEFDRVSLIEVWIDEEKYVLVPNACHTFLLNEGKHYCRLFKREEAQERKLGIKKIEAEAFYEVPFKKRKIEAFGDSTIAGYGNLGKLGEERTIENSSCLATFPFLTAEELNADIQMICASGWGLCHSIYAEKNLFDLYESKDEGRDLFHPDLEIISVGTNDLTLMPSRQEFINKYLELIRIIQNRHHCRIILISGVMRENMDDLIEEVMSYKIKDVYSLRLAGDTKGCHYHPSAKANQEMSCLLVNMIKKIMFWE